MYYIDGQRNKYSISQPYRPPRSVTEIALLFIYLFIYEHATFSSIKLYIFYDKLANDAKLQTDVAKRNLMEVDISHLSC
jgi:hypothetical protein